MGTLLNCDRAMHKQILPYNRVINTVWMDHILYKPQEFSFSSSVSVRMFPDQSQYAMRESTSLAYSTSARLHPSRGERLAPSLGHSIRQIARRRRLSIGLRMRMKQPRSRRPACRYGCLPSYNQGLLLFNAIRPGCCRCVVACHVMSM